MQPLAEPPLRGDGKAGAASAHRVPPQPPGVSLLPLHLPWEGGSEVRKGLWREAVNTGLCQAFVDAVSFNLCSNPTRQKCHLCLQMRKLRVTGAKAIYSCLEW